LALISTDLLTVSWLDLLALFSVNKGRLLAIKAVESMGVFVDKVAGGQSHIL
jgi:hypothetical protein